MSENPIYVRAGVRYDLNKNNSHSYLLLFFLRALPPFINRNGHKRGSDHSLRATDATKVFSPTTIIAAADKEGTRSSRVVVQTDGPAFELFNI
jgi:hypothetical protein